MRKVWFALLALPVIGFALFAQTNKFTEPKQPQYTVDEKWMLQYYDAVNEEYYDGKLPPITFDFVPNLKDYWGDPVEATSSISAPFHVRMDSGFKRYPPSAAENLIHETCHIYLDSTNRADKDDDHGKNFQSCMLDKAERGAFRDLW